MGTSRAYTAPTNGNWPRLKREVTEFGNVGDGTPGPEDPNNSAPQLPNIPFPTLPPLPSATQLLASYIRTLGGVSALIAGLSIAGASSGGGAALARAGNIGQSATRVGRNLGGFATRVNQADISTALREYGLENLIGQPVQEVTAGLIDALVGPDGTMDDDLAREALCLLRREQLAEAQTADDVERILKDTLGRIEVSGLVMQFYGHYLFAMFCRDFYERLQQKIGPDAADRSIESVRRTITAVLENELVGQDITRVDWGHAEGQELAERILVRTLTIFEVSE